MAEPVETVTSGHTLDVHATCEQLVGLDASARETPIDDWHGIVKPCRSDRDGKIAGIVFDPIFAVSETQGS